MINVTNILFISHSSKDEGSLIYSVVLGLSIFNMFGVSICMGICSALDTFATNAFGAKMYYLMGCYLNRTLVIVCVIYIVMFFPMFYLSKILLFLGHEEMVAYQAGQFIRGLLPGMLFVYLGDALRRFITPQGIVIQPIFIVLICSLLHPIWVYFFYVYLDWGAFGSGLSTSLSNSLNFFLMVILVKKYAVKGSLVKFNKDSFVGFVDYLKIAIPSMLMMCLETWNGQIVNFIVGYLNSPTQEKSFSMLNSFSSMIYMFPFGLSMGASMIIGKYIGRYSPIKVQISCKMILAFTFLFSFCIAVFLIGVRSYIPYMYSSDPEIVTLMERLIGFLIFYEFFDFMISTYGGIYRGIGMQKTITLANFVCYYILSLPLVYLLTFKCEWNVYGIWSSYCIGILALFISYICIHKYRLNFNVLCKEAQNRLNNDRKRITNIELDETFASHS